MRRGLQLVSVHGRALAVAGPGGRVDLDQLILVGVWLGFVVRTFIRFTQQHKAARTPAVS